jgi:hypothetical protein
VADNVLNRFRIASDTRDFELVETPKGIEARIDGIPLQDSEIYELARYLEVAKSGKKKIPG